MNKSKQPKVLISLQNYNYKWSQKMFVPPVYRPHYAWLGPPWPPEPVACYYYSSIFHTPNG